MDNKSGISYCLDNIFIVNNKRNGIYEGKDQIMRLMILTYDRKNGILSIYGQ